MSCRASITSIHLLFSRVEFLERLELLNECLVLVLQDRDAIFQAFDVLLFLSSAFSRGLSVIRRRKHILDVGLVIHIFLKLRNRLLTKFTFGHNLGAQMFVSFCLLCPHIPGQLRRGNK